MSLKRTVSRETSTCEPPSLDPLLQVIITPKDNDNDNDAKSTSSPLTSLVHGEKKDFPLHKAAQKGDAEELEAILQKLPSGCHPFTQDYKRRTPLHYAANYGNPTIAFRMTTSLLFSNSIIEDKHPLVARKNFLNIQDENLETALHLAAKNRHTRVVKQFIFNAADVNLMSKEGFEPIELIYKKVPLAMRAIFDTAIRHDSGEISEGNSHVLLDFAPIVGYPDLDEDYSLLKESAILVLSLKSSEDKCKEILVHPLVQLFLHFKWKKVRPIFWLSILIQITGLILFSTFLIDLYLTKCPFNPRPKDLQPSNASNTGFSVVHCSRESVHVHLPIFVATVAAFMLVKEVYQLCSVPTFIYYFKQMENLGQLLLIVIIGLTTLPVWTLLLRPEMSYVELHPWQYQVAAMGVLVAWLLILYQVGKSPSLGIYVAILLRVLRSVGLFILTFTSVLIAFALAFSILMPENIAFSTWPLALAKVLVMMTGELNYDDMFFSEDKDPLPTPFRTMGHMLFVLFVIIVTIILFNLLIGLTVSDIQGLQTVANISILSKQLEHIFLVESFLFSRHLNRLLKLLRINPNRLARRFHIAEMGENADFGMILPTRKIPSDLRQGVNELAAKNLSSDGERETFTANPSLCLPRVGNINEATLAGVTTEELREVIKEVMFEVLNNFQIKVA